jgi:hypothetical protein
MRSYGRHLRRSTKFATYGCVAVAGGMFLAAVADLLGVLDWGFGWPEVAAALGIGLFSLLLGVLSQGWFALIGLGEEPPDGQDG